MIREQKHRITLATGLTSVTHICDQRYRFFPELISECGQLVGLSARSEG
jgi:hypothetical protein